jgi:hypothetical protein
MFEGIRRCPANSETKEAEGVLASSQLPAEQICDLNDAASDFLHSMIIKKRRAIIDRSIAEVAQAAVAWEQLHAGAKGTDILDDPDAAVEAAMLNPPLDMQRHGPVIVHQACALQVGAAGHKRGRSSFQGVTPGSASRDAVLSTDQEPATSGIRIRILLVDKSCPNCTYVGHFHVPNAEAIEAGKAHPRTCNLCGSALNNVAPETLQQRVAAARERWVKHDHVQTT